MRANSIVLSLARCVLAGAASMLVACSGEDSAPPVVSSFHYVETVTGNIEGRSLDSREEGYYWAPDSARIAGNDPNSPLGLENIAIGPHVWRRDESGWSVDAYCFSALDKIHAILRYGGKHNDSTETGDGPTTEGESTQRYKWEYEDAGRLLISEAERSLGDSPQAQEVLAHTREVFRDLTATTDLIVGESTGRVYSLVYASNGPNMTRKDEIVLDQYDQPVDIQPPPNAPPPTEDHGARCPGPPGDFPWIPAAIAAVLGPLLFLGASAFLWRRRL